MPEPEFNAEGAEEGGGTGFIIHHSELITSSPRTSGFVVRNLVP